MLEYALVLGICILGSIIMQAMGWPTALWMLCIIVLTLPTLYAAYAGAPYVPTDPKTVQSMIQLAEIVPGERVIDLGCGDGRLIQAAQAAGAKAKGYEVSLYLFILGRFIKNLDVRFKDLWKVDVSEADVIFCYLNPRTLARFEQELWPQCKPGCRVILNTFALPHVNPTKKVGTIYRYDKT